MAYGYNDMLALLQELQDFAWLAPMRDLATKVGLSDVGLKKLLTSYRVVTHPQGIGIRSMRADRSRNVRRCPHAGQARLVGFASINASRAS